MVEERFYADVSDDDIWADALENEAWIAPLVDIYETEEEFFLIANIPGISKENLRVKIENGNLVIMGRSKYQEHLDRKYSLKETENGNFYRRIKISENVDEDKIEAKFENGQLISRMPKNKKEIMHEIEIK